MFTEALERLRDKVQRRGKALLAIDRLRDFYFLLRRFMQFIAVDETLAAIVLELVKKETKAEAIASVIDSQSFREMAETPTYSLTAAAGFLVLKKIAAATPDVKTWPKGLQGFPDEGLMLCEMRSRFLTPILDYLEEKLDEQATIIGVLIRYKDRSEWFNREVLAEEATEEDQSRYGRVEDVLKRDLYRYLHDNGVRLIVEPLRGHGRIDVILDDGEGRRAYAEGKVFDDKSRDKRYIRQGFSQLMGYLDQYNASTGYLVIYNVAAQMLSVAGDGDILTVQFVRHNGKTLFMLIVNLGPEGQPASKREGTTVTLTRDDLVHAKET